MNRSTGSQSRGSGSARTCNMNRRTGASSLLFESCAPSSPKSSGCVTERCVSIADVGTWRAVSLLLTMETTHTTPPQKKTSWMLGMFWDYYSEPDKYPAQIVCPFWLQCFPFNHHRMELHWKDFSKQRKQKVSIFTRKASGLSPTQRVLQPKLLPL